MPPKLKLLLFTDWFSPAFKAGGPVRSVVNLADRFKGLYDVYVFTSDRDLNDTRSFDDIISDEWISADGIHIYYYSPAKMTYAHVKSTIADINLKSAEISSAAVVDNGVPDDTLLCVYNAGAVNLIPSSVFNFVISASLLLNSFSRTRTGRLATAASS